MSAPLFVATALLPFMSVHPNVTARRSIDSLPGAHLQWRRRRLCAVQLERRLDQHSRGAARLAAGRAMEAVDTREDTRRLCNDLRHE